VRMGIEAEKEHKKTIDIIRENLKKGITNNDIYELITKDHLDEDPHYYTHLKEMELKFKKV
jgi:hypothetical protein